MYFSAMLALVAGCLLPLAFAPFNFYWLAFLSPAVLFYLWLRSTPVQAFKKGLLFGIGFFSVGIYWIYISINTYGNTPTTISLIITVLFILVLSLFPATQGYLITKIFRHKNNTAKCLCVFPASWVIWEWLRSALLTGFPWLFLGYTQISTPLHGLAPLFGVYGISLAVVLISGSLVLLIQRCSQFIKILSIIIIFSLIGIGWAFAYLQWTKPAGPNIKVSLIQGNIKQQIKWQPDRLISILNIYRNLTEQHWSSQFIIWPEAAISTFPQQIQTFMDDLDAAAKRHNVYLLIGAPLINLESKQFYNGMIMLGVGSGKYLKRHLVPFGEYLPLKFLFSWFTNYFQIPMSDFSPGPKQQTPIQINHFKLATFICYEIAYPIEVLEAIKDKQMIIALIDDSWFGDSTALDQHFQIARMRALETGRYVLLCTNTGITAFINPLGKVIAKAPVNKQFALTANAIPMKGNTPLMQWNYYPVAAVIIILLLVGFLI